MNEATIGESLRYAGMSKSLVVVQSMERVFFSVERLAVSDRRTDTVTRQPEGQRAIQPPERERREKIKIIHKATLEEICPSHRKFPNGRREHHSDVAHTAPNARSFHPFI